MQFFFPRSSRGHHKKDGICYWYVPRMCNAAYYELQINKNKTKHVQAEDWVGVLKCLLLCLYPLLQSFKDESWKHQLRKAKDIGKEN